MLGPQTPWSARWTGTITPPATGTYRFSLTGSSTIQLYVNNTSVAAMMKADFGQTVQGAVRLKGGKPVPVESPPNRRGLP